MSSPMSHHNGRASTPEESQPPAPRYDQQRYLLVVDPISRKLNIPIESVCETLARYRLGTPSLCMLFLNNRCRQGQNCHQVHADPTVVLALRNQAQQSLMCCMTHGDRAPMEQRYQDKYVLSFAGGSGNTIPINRLAMTQGLARFIDEFEQSNGVPDMEDVEKVRLSPSVTTVCRLHGQDRCRFSEECKFLHLCKELLWCEISIAGMSNSSQHQIQHQHHNRRYSNSHHQQAPPSPYHSDGMPPSPTMGAQSYMSNSQLRGYYSTPGQMSNESLISMDLTATPPMTPTSPAMNSPVVKHQSAGDSWSYEPYGFNPIPSLPPAMDEEI